MGTINVDTIKNNVGGNTDIKIGDAPLSSSSGNLGLGTVSPDELLHLKTTSDADLGIKVENDDTQAFCKVQSTGNALYGGNQGVNVVSGGSFATAMNIDSSGHVTKPLQSAFLARPSTQQTFSTNSNNSVAFATEVYDQNSDYNTSNSTFTAPVTGKYYLSAMGRTDAVDSATDFHNFRIETSNRNYHDLQSTHMFDADGAITFNVQVCADMDANDTATVVIELTNDGSNQANVNQNTSHFSGVLIC